MADRGAVAQISWRSGRERRAVGLGLALQIADQRAEGRVRVSRVSCTAIRAVCRVHVLGVGCVGWCFAYALMKFTT